MSLEKELYYYLTDEQKEVIKEIERAIRKDRGGAIVYSVDVILEIFLKGIKYYQERRL